MVGRFSPEALAQYQAQAVSTPIGSPLKYAYTPDNRLGANAVEYKLSAQPAKLEFSGSTVLLALAAGWLLNEALGSNIGKSFKGNISKKLGG